MDDAETTLSSVLIWSWWWQPQMFGYRW